MPHAPNRVCLARLLGRGAAILTVGLIVALVAGFFIYAGRVKSYDAPSDARADAIVVLTGGAQRIDEALQLMTLGRGRRMLISGVNEQTTREELVRLNPAYAPLFACCIDLDYMARNTIGNAIRARSWVRDNAFGSIIIVTSNYHMPRTLLELGHAMPGVEKIPYAVSAGSIDTDQWWRNGATLHVLMSEYVKYLAAFARTRFEKDPERASTARILGKPVKAIVEPQAR